MPRFQQPDYSRLSFAGRVPRFVKVSQGRFDRPVLGGKLGLGHRQVELRRQFNVSAYLFCIRTGFGTQFPQDSLDFTFFLGFQFAQGVAHFNGCPRLHKHGGSGIGNVVDDAAKFPPEFNFYRNNITPFPFRNYRLLYYLLSMGGFHQ